MAQFFSIHPTHPQQRLVHRAGDILRGGGLIAYPTDSCYALGCRRNSRAPRARARARHRRRIVRRRAEHRNRSHRRCAARAAQGPGFARAFRRRGRLIESPSQMDVNSLVQTLAIYALPVLFAITLHEAAHGYVARHFGDMTAHAQGRISLNPLRHIDIVGTIVVPVVVLLLTKNLVGGGLLFGWAKPVPVNYSALRKPRQHMALVAAAGPGANLVMALLWALLLKVSVLIANNGFSQPMGLMAQAGIFVNLIFIFL